MIKGLLTILQLAASIAKMAKSLPSAPSDLREKHRWMTVTIHNETQFNIVWAGQDYFDSGRFWTAPTNINSFSSMTFSACNKDNSILTGCSGGAAFYIQLPDGATSPFAVGFTNPQLGAIKASVVKSSKARDAYDAATSNSTSTVTAPLEGVDVDGNTVTLSFSMVAAPGQEAAITITQVQAARAVAA